MEVYFIQRFGFIILGIFPSHYGSVSKKENEKVAVKKKADMLFGSLIYNWRNAKCIYNSDEILSFIKINVLWVIQANFIISYVIVASCSPPNIIALWKKYLNCFFCEIINS